MSHIRYDGCGELHITGMDEAVQIKKSPFDKVITVCQERIDDNLPADIAYSFYCMSDGEHSTEKVYGGSCDYDLFEAAANELYQTLADGQTVLIHCHAGQSRSVAVATAALAQLLEVSRFEAIDRIHYYRPVGHYPDRKLMQHASQYIDTHTNVRNFIFLGEGEDE